MTQPSKDTGIEDGILSFVAIGGALLLIGPILVLASLKVRLSLYQNLSWKDSLKGLYLGIISAVLIILVHLVCPFLTSLELFHLGKFKFRAGMILLWVAGNLFLGGLSYFLIPFLRRWVRGQSSMKDELF